VSTDLWFTVHHHDLQKIWPFGSLGQSNLSHCVISGQHLPPPSHRGQLNIFKQFGPLAFLKKIHNNVLDISMGFAGYVSAFVQLHCVEQYSAAGR
jgi:hypothetical protein